MTTFEEPSFSPRVRRQVTVGLHHKRGIVLAQGQTDASYDGAEVGRWMIKVHPFSCLSLGPGGSGIIICLLSTTEFSVDRHESLQPVRADHAESGCFQSLCTLVLLLTTSMYCPRRHDLQRRRCATHGLRDVGFDIPTIPTDARRGKAGP